MRIQEITNARILYYDLFANLFLYELLLKNQSNLSKQFKILQDFALSEEDHLCFQKLQEHNQDFISQYTKTFLLPFSQQKCIQPYYSYCVQKRLGGEPLALVKSVLKQYGLYFNKDFSSENEDHFGVFCLLMKHLLEQNHLEEANEIYVNYIALMKDEILQGLQGFEGSVYLYVGKILKSFLDLEDEICGLI